MNGYWKVLGIAPTGDKKAIRAAYSAMTRQCHPEEDPEGFKQLHEAYQAAMAYASSSAGRAERREEMPEGPGKEERADKPENAQNGGTASAEKNTPESQAINEDTKGEETAEHAPSLLDRLDRAKEEELSHSLCSGALKQFSAVLNDPKRFRRADAWKAFFLSEDFLKEQYQESFADGMLRILEDFHTEDNYDMVHMAGSFLTELAIAYALVLNSGQSERRTDSFYAREAAASIWNMQTAEYSLPFGLLGRPENQVRLRSFDDYIRLRDYHRRGLLTRKNQEDWEELLRGGAANHLYELKGKGRHEIYATSRSVCLLDLYAFWIREEDVPECILEYIYRKYDLRGAEHTSTRKLYEPLKQAIFLRYPNIEEALFGEEGRAKQISSWYRELMGIISDNERFCEETQEIRVRVRELFAKEEWQKIRYMPELFGKMELQLLGRSVLPASLAKRLMEFFGEEKGLQEQAWDKEQGVVMTEEMIHSLYYSRKIRDMHGIVPEVTPVFCGGKLREVYKRGAGNGPEAASKTGDAPEEFRADGKEEYCASKDAIFCTDFLEGYPEVLRVQDFWHYFLMRGFGCRSARIDGRGKYRRKYMVGMNASLPSYIDYLYQPSERWQRLFTGVGGEEAEKRSHRDKENIPMPQFCRFFTDEDGKTVPGMEFALPDGKDFRMEFHLHYVRCFLEGEEVFRPLYSFPEYAELAKGLPYMEQRLVLLAVTEISGEDCAAAQELMECMLAALPLAPVSIPVIARLLAEGTEDEAAGGKVPAGFYSGHISLKKAAESSEYLENDREEKTVNRLGNEEEGNRLCGVYYAEDEELCFRAVVRENGFSIFIQNDFGWEPFYTAAFYPADGERMLSPEAKCRIARKFLRGMKSPAPVLRTSLSLEGMTEVEKAEQILEAMKQDALYRGLRHGLLPHRPGYPWEERDTGRGQETAKEAKKDTDEAPAENALQHFYRQYGGYLPECYCVLRFGEEDTQVKKDHVFYASMEPFGFALGLRAPDWPSSYKYRMEELHRKVKEKHWAVGHFGWGDLSEPDGESVPKIVAVGVSGTYYYYDIIRMLRGDNLAALLARMFDFSKVAAVECYEGELSISRLSGELEYCYSREAFLQSTYTPGKTTADLFTFFTKAELMGEFAAFMDGLLGELDGELTNLHFEFRNAGEGAYAMRIFLQNALGQKQELCSCKDSGAGAENTDSAGRMQSGKRLVWKIWQQAEDPEAMYRDITDALHWYMDCGKYGEKLRGCQRITGGFDARKGSGASRDLKKSATGCRFKAAAD